MTEMETGRGREREADFSSLAATVVREEEEEIGESFSTSVNTLEDTFSDQNYSHISTCSLFCLPHYRIQRVPSKGAWLVLLWNFLIFMVYYQIGGGSAVSDLLNYMPYLRNQSLTILGFLYLLYPFMAWLADVRVGRVRMVRYSMVLLWVFSLVGATVFTVRSAVGGGVVVDRVILPLTFCGLGVGLAGFQANIIQLGLDQLLDASAETIKAFVLWYVWTIFAGGSVMLLVCRCLLKDLVILRSFFLCVALSLTLISDFFLGRYLHIAPLLENPLSSIIRVLRYASKQIRPAARSAFTYWEEKRPSRVDLGKRKYGGPFEEEEVEDVKTFLRILGIIIVVYVFVNANSVGNIINYVTVSRLQGPSPTSTSGCLVHHTVAYMDTHIITLLLPLYLLIIQPCCRQWFTRVSILQVFGVSLLVSLIGYSTQTTLNVIADTTTNSTQACLLNHFQYNPGPKLSLSYFWLLFPTTLSGTSMLLFYSSSIVFMVAQAPYTMRSFVIGLSYGVMGLYGTVIAILIVVVSMLPHSSSLLSCVSWMLIAMGGVILLGLFAFLIAAYKYRQRSRTEVINHHIFAERMYSQHGGETGHKPFRIISDIFVSSNSHQSSAPQSINNTNYPRGTNIEILDS